MSSGLGVLTLDPHIIAMIRYALVCEAAHEFEAWFRNSEDYDVQSERGLVECPLCGTHQVRKAIMAPAVSASTRKSDGGQKIMMEMAGKLRKHIAENFDYVGDRFASEARAMHVGDAPERAIYGETTPEETKALKEEGVPCAPLPDALVPTPAKKVN